MRKKLCDDLIAVPNFQSVAQLYPLVFKSHFKNILYRIIFFFISLPIGKLAN